MREDVKKVVGIMIPEECGKADKYELTAIMYNEEDADGPVNEYSVFIVSEDYEENKPFTTIKGNMNPTLLLLVQKPIKPPAMQVCPQIALASRKKPPWYNKCRFANRINNIKEVSSNGQK